MGFLLTLITALLVFGALLLSRVWPTWPSRLTVFGVALFGLTVLSFQVLGIVAAAFKVAAVQPAWLLASAAGTCAISWRASMFLRSRTRLSSKRGDVADGEGPGAEERGSGPLWTRWAPAAVIGAVSLAILPNAAALGLSAPPRGWDVLTYHMPKALAWLQHGNLGNYGSLAAYYPGNSEIAILFSLFAGTDRFAPLVQLPFALLGSVALYGVGRELGARRMSATVPAVVFLAAPIVLFQSALAKDDLIVTALVLAGVYLLLRSIRGRAGHRLSIVELGASGFALGLALGSKYTILPFVAASVPIVALLPAAGRRLGGGRSESELGPPRVGRAGGALSSAIRGTAVFVAALALPSIFWFAQNCVVTGNPFAPVLVKLGGWTAFEGVSVASTFGEQQFMYVRRLCDWWVFPWVDRASQGSYSASSGFGAAFATFVVPALALCGWLCLPGRSPGRKRLPRMTILWFMVAGIATWWFGGFHLPRYLWPALALACAPVALLFDRVARGLRFALIGLLVLAVLFSTGEALRVIYGADDLVSSHKGFVGKIEHYNMPELIYELPAGTRILLLDVPGVQVFRTFRYPVAGDLPGNEVFMTGDLGFDTDLVRGGPVLGHSGLVRAEIDYLFLRTLALPPGLTVFDKYPDLYEKVLDTVEMPYPWYRKGYLPTPGGEFVKRAPVVTKIYRVLPT